MRLSSVAVLFFVAALAAPVAGQEGRARVDGRVTNEGGAALEGATISARHLARPRGVEVWSDSRGRFVMDGLASGSWTVEIAAPGYSTRRIGVHLPSESSWLDLFEVRLEKTRPDPSSSAPWPPAVAPAESEAPASYEDVRAALAEGRVDRARRLLASVDPSAPGEAVVLFEIGEGLLTAGETEEAVASFGRALDRDPDHADAHYARALGLLALGRPEEARRDFEAVIALRPEGALAEKAALAIEQLASAPAPAPPVPPRSSSHLRRETAE